MSNDYQFLQMLKRDLAAASTQAAKDMLLRQIGHWALTLDERGELQLGPRYQFITATGQYASDCQANTCVKGSRTIKKNDRIVWYPATDKQDQKATSRGCYHEECWQEEHRNSRSEKTA